MNPTEPSSFSPVFLDHAQHPRNLGPMAAFDGHARMSGSCGDTMDFWIRVRGNMVDKITFSTDGCGSSLACGSMAAELAGGRTLEDLADLSANEIQSALGGLPEAEMHCATLAAETARAAGEDFFHRQVRRRAKSGQSAHRGCSSCDNSTCSAADRRPGESDDDFQQRRLLQERMCRIRHKVVVLSGKGGVGKSTVAVNLAMALALAGKRVGLLDVDVHGPSIPTMLGLEGAHATGDESGLAPIDLGRLKVLSVGFFLRHQDDAVIWRGPMKYSVIRQFLKDAAWGDLAYLVIDSPPGTGDEPLSVCQLIGDLDGARIVTTPQRVAAVDVRKSISFCRQLGLPVLGVVENMGGFACPRCGEITPIFQAGGGKRIADDMDVPFLGSIPIDPRIAESCDEGRAFIQKYAASPTARMMLEIIRPVLALDESEDITTIPEQPKSTEVLPMRIAIPLADGRRALHFGHCDHFALLDVDQAARKILGRQDIEAPPHQPGLLPPWLAERGANVIIAGGMGQRALALFAEQGIQVVVGAPAETPEQIVAAYLNGTLQVGGNVCDH